MSQKPSEAAPRELQIAKNTLVGILFPDHFPNERLSLARSYWGQVVEKVGENYRIFTGRKIDAMVDIPESQLVYGIKTNGLAKKPQRLFVDNEALITGIAWDYVLRKQGFVQPDLKPPAIIPPGGWDIPIEENVLARVLPDGDGDIRWGLIRRKTQYGTYCVQVGRFAIGRGKVSARLDRIIPIYETDGHCKSPRHALWKYRNFLEDELGMRLFTIRPFSDRIEGMRVVGKILYDSKVVLDVA